MLVRKNRGMDMTFAMPDGFLATYCEELCSKWPFTPSPFLNIP